MDPGSGGPPATLTVECPTSAGGEELVGAVAFASYGTPSGACDATGGAGTLKVNGSCHAASSADVAAKACVGKNSCTLAADNDAFGGDPCHLTRKRLALCVTCEKQPKAAPASHAAGGGGGGDGQCPCVASQPFVAVPAPRAHLACTTRTLGVPKHGSPNEVVFGQSRHAACDTHADAT